MPGCVLRVNGSTSKVKKFLGSCSLEPSIVYWREDPGSIKSRGASLVSGFNISMSDADGNSVEKQARQALAFIRKHQEDMLLLQALRFKSPTVDFGLYDLATEDRPWPSYRLPAPFIQAAGDLGLEIVLSFYGAP